MFVVVAVSAIDESRFSVVVLGCGGGPQEDNLSGYMAWPTGLSEEAVFLDAGTLTIGIREAMGLGNLWDFSVPVDSNLTLEGFVLQNAKAYLISHAHLDHIAGLVINSPVDSKKDILGIDSTITYLQNDIFNWEIWPNFGDAGPGYPLATYHYVILNPGEEVPVSNTSMTVEGYVLSHGTAYESTAFLLQHNGYYLLYFGDTGPDAVEQSDRMEIVWKRIAPLVQKHKLLGIFLEVAYAEGCSDSSLFGHLTPSWMMSEFHRLAELTAPDNPEQALNGLKVVVTHIKPILRNVPAPGFLIPQELAELNDLGIEFIIPFQGMRLSF
jgi:3',5'-cyclic-nucleotide phosphodiesterase